jgi:hypothetical protein
MKNLLKFMGVLIGIFIWVELIDLSFNLMTLPSTFYFYGGVLMIALLTVGPILYFGDNILMFLKNMKGVFTYKDKKDGE